MVQSSRGSSDKAQLKKGRRTMDSWLQESNDDDDLTLFQEMRKRERKNDIHAFNVDIEASLSTQFGGLTGYRLAASTPPWKANDDLSLDAGKNDYNWLITPPGTPLFESLDQDTQPANDLQRSARNRTYSTYTVSKSSEPKTRGGQRHRTNTHRANTALSTNNSKSGRVSSVPRIPRPLNATQPSERASRPLNRAPSKGFPTSTMRRLNTSSSIQSSSPERIGRSRGTSLSPKMQACKPPLEGTSFETPPNLRTSISDCQAPITRNVASISRHVVASEARNACLKAGDVTQSRQHNVSSYGSKSSISPKSQDNCSSRGSIISSLDALEITQPVLLAHTTQSSNFLLHDAKTKRTLKDRSNNSYSPPENCHIGLASVAEEATTISSATKRKSLAQSMQQGDNSCIPPIMFRPLLLSPPASSFYHDGDSSLQHRPEHSMVESSITASSNASSEQGVRIALGNDSSGEEEKDDTQLDKSLRDTMNTVVDDTDVTDPEYVDKVYGTYARHAYDNHFNGESDSISRSTYANHFSIHNACEINNVRIEKIPDQVGEEASTGRKFGRGNCPIATEFPIYRSDNSSLENDSTGVDYQKGLPVSPHSEKSADRVFVDIQEDLSVHRFGANMDQELQKVEHESATWSLQKIGLLWPYELKIGSNMIQNQSPNLGVDHFRDPIMHTSDTIATFCASTISSRNSKDDCNAYLHSELPDDSQKSLQRENSATYVKPSLDHDISAGTHRLECPFEYSPRTRNYARTISYEDCDKYLFDNSKLSVNMDNRDATPSSQKEQGFLDQSDLVSEGSCREYFIDFLETTASATSRISETTGFGSPTKRLLLTGNDTMVNAVPRAGRGSSQTSLSINLEEVDKVLSLTNTPKTIGLERKERHHADSPDSLNQISGWKPVTRNFTLEEATDTILFCSSIVHGIVYRAASIATEKEESVSAVPAGAQCESLSTVYSKGQVLNWKTLPREAISAVRRSLTYQQSKEETMNEVSTITMPPSMDQMKSDGLESENKTKDAAEIGNEMSLNQSTRNSCGCTIM